MYADWALLWMPIVGQEASINKYDNQLSITMDPVWPFKELAEADPELALAMAKIVFYPYVSPGQWRAHVSPLLDSGVGMIAHPGPRTIARWRQACGLRPIQAVSPATGAGQGRAEE
jgi:hypothetical protein